MQAKIRVIGARGRKPIPCMCDRKELAPSLRPAPPSRQRLYTWAHTWQGAEPQGHVCPHACQGHGDKDPVQAVHRSHGQKEGHGQQRKSTRTITHRAGIAPPPPCTSSAGNPQLSSPGGPGLILPRFQHLFAAGIPPRWLRKCIAVS